MARLAETVSSLFIDERWFTRLLTPASRFSTLESSIDGRGKSESHTASRTEPSQTQPLPHPRFALTNLIRRGVRRVSGTPRKANIRQSQKPRTSEFYETNGCRMAQKRMWYSETVLWAI